jgi:hypothetical protein
MEALNIYIEEKQKLKEFNEARNRCATQEEKDKIKMDPKHLMLVALGDITEEEHVLETLKKTKSR